MSIRVDSWLKPFSSTALGFREKLSPGFEPIRIRVTRQRKPAAAFGNEVGPQTNFLIGRSRRCSRFGRHRDLGFLRRRTFLATRWGAFSTRRWLPRARHFAGLHFGGRSGGFRWRLIFALDNFVLFRHRFVGVDDSNPFTAHRPVRKRFLARVWWNEKSP